jgi:imidazolonepropionase
LKADLLITNAGELATPVAGPEFALAGFFTLADAAVAAYRGEIVWVGSAADVRTNIETDKNCRILNASGKCLTPGFVDSHTHPIFSATREDEFEMRIAGRSYEEIALAGGGIRSTVRKLRKSSKEELVQLALSHLDAFISHGTTTIEAKSGYGLSLADEVKSLEAIRQLNSMHPLDLVPTFLGAHEIPDEYRQNKAAYVDLVINEMIPAVKEAGLAEFCDVFCESHVFDVNDSRKILTAAKAAGFELKIHADQLTRNGGGELAAELGAISADHLENSTQSDWEKMKASGVVPVMLPGAVFFLGKNHYAPARRMLELGMPVAVASDFNPGSCMSESMPMMLTLSCLRLGLSPSEALTAATYHGALAVRRGNLLGTIEVGKKADLVIWNAPNHKHLPYHFGINLAETVIKSGKVVYENKAANHVI